MSPEDLVFPITAEPLPTLVISSQVTAREGIAMPTLFTSIALAGSILLAQKVYVVTFFFFLND